jgi:hypothetical protein
MWQVPGRTAAARGVLTGVPPEGSQPTSALHTAETGGLRTIGDRTGGFRRKDGTEHNLLRCRLARHMQTLGAVHAADISEA